MIHNKNKSILNMIFTFLSHYCKRNHNFDWYFYIKITLKILLIFSLGYVNKELRVRLSLRNFPFSLCFVYSIYSTFLILVFNLYMYTAIFFYVKYWYLFELINLYTYEDIKWNNTRFSYSRQMLIFSRLSISIFRDFHDKKL